jgi:ankyrin repeat protein
MTSLPEGLTGMRFQLGSNASDLDYYMPDRNSHVFRPVQRQNTRSLGETRKLLRDGKLDPNSIDLEYTNRSLFEIALMKNQLDVAELMLEFKADINLIDYNGVTELMVSVRLGNMWKIKWLMDHKADPHIRSPVDRKTAFVYARESKYKQEILALLSPPAPAPAPAPPPMTPFPVVPSNVQRLPDPAQPNSSRTAQPTMGQNVMATTTSQVDQSSAATATTTTVSYDIDHNLLDAIRRRLENGLDPNAQTLELDGHYSSPFKMAVEAYNIDMMQLMFEFKADVNQLDIDMMQLMFEFKADVNQLDITGWTPLMNTCLNHGENSEEKSYAVAKWLLDHKADPSIRTGLSSKTALDIARSYGRKDLVHLLTASIPTAPPPPRPDFSPKTPDVPTWHCTKQGKEHVYFCSHDVNIDEPPLAQSTVADNEQSSSKEQQQDILDRLIDGMD